MRLFIALEIPDEIKKKISKIQNILKKYDNNSIKWVRQGSLHITLKFLGEVKNEFISDIENSLVNIEMRKEKLEIKNLGCFPNINRPRILWAGVYNKWLIEFAGIIDISMNKIGFKKEKRQFSGHLTIGRVKKGISKNFKRKYIELMETEIGEFNINSFYLFESKLNPTGAEYFKFKSFSA